LKHQGHQAHQGHQELGAGIDDLARVIVDAGLKIHRTLGPGLLESVNEHCLAHELRTRAIAFQRQVGLPVSYEGLVLEAGYRLDLLVENQVVVEVKAVDALARVHGAQILTYLKLSGHRLGLLMNFNVELLKHGVKRFVI
jgi:GxxExxY protein